MERTALEKVELRRVAVVLVAGPEQALALVEGQTQPLALVGLLVRERAPLQATRWQALVQLVESVAPRALVGTLGCQLVRSGCLGPPRLALALEAPEEQVKQAVPSLFANSFPHQAPSVPNGGP